MEKIRLSEIESLQTEAHEVFPTSLCLLTPESKNPRRKWRKQSEGVLESSVFYMAKDFAGKNVARGVDT